MFKQSFSRSDYSRQTIKGVFFCKASVNKDDCKKLVEDLGCTILLDKGDNLTIQATRARLKDLKSRYLSSEEDKSEISNRLKSHFERILIGGASS